MTEIGRDKINSCLLYFFILPGQLVNQNCEPVHNLHETTATAVEKPECTLYCKHFRDEVKMN
ncbi:hypothetical protein EZ402_08045 [Shigella flexneri]|nr:hypothetical protein [Shigella flexneri]